MLVKAWPLFQRSVRRMSDERDDGRREAVDAADATGLIAGEELITEAETLMPLRELHAALPADHAAHATIDDLHAQLTSTSPDAQSIARHVGHLRTLPELQAIVANWWDSPQTQRIVAGIGQIGL
jgi:hypothetical protein